MRKLYYYKQVSSSEMKTKIKNNPYLSLSSYQLGIIEEVLDEYHIYDFECQKPKVSPLWRLTIVFYLIAWLLLVSSMPYKWVFTGSRYYKSNSRVVRFMEAWSSKLHL